MTEIQVTTEAPPEDEPKVLTNFKSLLHLFNIDTTQWNTTAAIKWILIKILLSVVIIPFAFFTVKTGWPLILDYTKSPTSFIQKTLFNTSIALPQSVVCLPLMSDELDNSSVGVSKHSSEFKTHYQKLISAFFNKTLTKEALLLEKSMWPTSLLFVVHQYLAFITQVEELYGKEIVKQMIIQKDFYNDLTQSFSILDNWMEVSNTSSSELKEKFGKITKELFDFSIDHRNISSNYAKVEVDSYLLSVYGDPVSSVCYVARFDQYPLKEKESIYIQAKRSNLPHPLPSSSSDYISVYLGRKLSFNQYDEIMASMFNSIVYLVPLQVASSYRSIASVDGKKRCNENRSYDMCAIECRRNYFKEKCGCLPTLGHMETVIKDTVCTAQIYMACFGDENTLDSGEAQEHLVQCEKECLDICQRTHYSLGYSAYYYQPEDALYKEANYSLIQLSIAYFDYPIFEETPKWTFASLIGVLGGALGIWLGINILDTIVYVANGLKIFFHACVGKTFEEYIKESASKHLEKNGKINENHSTLSYLKSNAVSTKSTCTFRFKISKWTVRIKFLELLFRILLGLFTLAIVGSALREYQSQRTITDVNVENNDLLALPNATICLPLNFGDLCRFSKNQRTNDTLELVQFLNKENVTINDFLPKTEHWSNAVRDVVHAYLIELSNCEAGEFSQCNQILMKEDDLISAMNVLEMIMAKANISIDELRQRFGYEVAQLYSFNISLEDTNGYQEHINYSRTNYIGNEQICYDMLFNLHPLKSTSYFTIVLSENSLQNSQYVNNNRNFTVDFANRLFLRDDRSETLLQPYFNFSMTYMLEMSNYRMLNKLNGGEIDCNELTLDQCEAVCRIKFIRNRCKCSPTSWPNLFSYIDNTTYDTCNMTSYTSCLSEMNSGTIEECTNQCLIPCERFNLIIRSATYTKSDGHTQASILFNNMNIIVFREKLAWSTEKLLEIIGGIVGFILGCSFYEIICFACIPFVGFLTHLLKKIGLPILVKLKIHPAQNNVTANSRDQSTENSTDHNEGENFVSVLKKLGWEVDKLQWIIEHILKLIVIAYFGWLTAKMCTPIIFNYNESKTHFDINVTINEPFCLKPATLCIDLYLTELDFNAQINSDDFSKYAGGIHKYFNRSNVTKQIFLGITNWTHVIRFIAHIYLAELSDTEMIVGSARRDLTLRTSTDRSLPSYFKAQWSKDIYTALTLLENKMTSLNVTVNELRQKFGREMAVLFSLHASQSTDCEGYLSCQNSTIIPIGDMSLINREFICYQLPLHLYPFRHPLQGIYISANSHSLPNKSVTDENRRMRVSLVGSNMSRLLSPIYENAYLVSVQFSDQIRQSVAISEKFQLMASRGKCSEYKTIETCLAECRIALFQQMCNCTPVTWSSWVSVDTYEECKLTNYTSCLNYTGNDDDNCVKEHCDVQVNMCERVVFTGAMLSDYITPYDAYIWLQIASFDYTTFIEQYEQSFEEFIGVLGGAIGFYLGLDFFRISLIFWKLIVSIGTLLTFFQKKLNSNQLFV